MVSIYLLFVQFFLFFCLVFRIDFILVMGHLFLLLSMSNNLDAAGHCKY